MTSMPAKARESPTGFSPPRLHVRRQRPAARTAVRIETRRASVPACSSSVRMQAQAGTLVLRGDRTMLKQLLSAVLIVVLASTAAAQDWGDLDGTFLYKGTPPTPNKIRPEKDPEYCGKHDIFD